MNTMMLAFIGIAEVFVILLVLLVMAGLAVGVVLLTVWLVRRGSGPTSAPLASHREEEPLAGRPARLAFFETQGGRVQMRWGVYAPGLALVLVISALLNGLLLAAGVWSGVDTVLFGLLAGAVIFNVIVIYDFNRAVKAATLNPPATGNPPSTGNPHPPSPTPSASCPRCGAPLPAHSPQGLCPRCVMGVGMATQTEAPGENGPHGTRITKPAPTLEELAVRFPHLEILECLGRGGMGVVYKARQPKLNRLIALKILAPEKGADPKFAERFQREAQALARLSHPNIVTVHDFGEADGMFFLIMEHVDGMTLRHLLREGHLKPEEALAIVPKVCEALQFAHEQGIVHRDIKPENVLLDKQGRVKIADFGIAKIVGGTPLTPSDGERAAVKPGEGSLTQDQILGTPHYMAPEQVEKPQLVDHRADIYSLGVVFYEMLTGELPLGKFQPPSRKVQVDVRLDDVVLHALQREPERRYQHASEVKTDVETIAAGAKSEIRSPKSEAEDVSEPARPTRRGRSPVVAATFWFALSLVPWALLVYLTFILPHQAEARKAAGTELPVMVRGLVHLSEFLQNAGFFLLPTLCLFTGVAFVWLLLALSKSWSEKRPPQPAHSPEHARPVPWTTVAALSVALAYAVGTLAGSFLSLLQVGGTSFWMLALFLLTALGSPFVGIAVLRPGKPDIRRAFLKAVSLAAFITALPIIGFAAFFLYALNQESSGWNPAPAEAVIVPLIWLGALALPLCGIRLWRAAAAHGDGHERQSAPAEGTLPPQSWQRAENTEQQAQRPSATTADWLRIVRRALLTGFVVWCLTVAGVIIFTALLRDQYAAQSRVLLRRMVPAEVAEQSAQLPEISAVEMATQMAVIQSRDLLGRVVTNLNLNEEWGRKYGRGETFQTSATTDLLKNRMVLNAGRDLITIQFFDESPSEAAKLANAVAESFIKWHEGIVGDYQNQPALKPSGGLVVPDAPKLYRVQLVQEAVAPVRPTRPNRVLNIVLGGGAGVFLGAIAAALTGLIAWSRQRSTTSRPITPKPDRFWRWLAVGLAAVVLAPILILVSTMLLGIVLGVFSRAKHQAQRPAVSQTAPVDTLPTPAKQSPSLRPVIESVKVNGEQAVIKGRSLHDASMFIMIGTNSSFWVSGHHGSPFTVTLEGSWFEGGYSWVIKRSLGNMGYRLEGDFGPVTGHIEFREGTPSAEPDGSYVIGEFQPDDGQPLPITVRLKSAGHSEGKPPLATIDTAASFGPVVECVVNGLMDLDAGTLLDWSELEAAEIEAQKKAAEVGELRPPWMRERGMDLYTWERALAGVDIRFVALESRDWQGITVSELQERLRSLNPTRMPPLSFPVAATARTYGFRTSEGSLGILQITGFADDQRGVKLRYKLVQSQPPEWFGGPSPATLEFRLVAPEESAAPADLLPDPNDPSGQRQLRVLRQAVADGSDVASAGLVFERDGSRSVSVQLSPDGSKRFAGITATNIGRQLALVFRGKLINAPVIRSPIRDGRLAITGRFSSPEAHAMVDSLNRTARPTVESWHLSEPVEVVLPEATATNFVLFDLDSERWATNRVLRPDLRESREWLHATGADVAALRQLIKQPVITGYDMVLAVAPSNAWDLVTAADLVQCVTLTDSAPRQEINRAQDAVADTFLFLTREGGRGVVQVLGFSDDPSGVEIRYKLVQDETSPPATDQVMRIQMDNAAFTDAVKMLAQQMNLNYAIDEDVLSEQKRAPLVTVDWKELTVRQALTALLESRGLELVPNPETGILRIRKKTSAADPTRPSDAGRPLQR